MPVVGRKTDLCSCPLHGSGEIVGPGFAEVLIGHEPVVRKGDKVRCVTGEIATIIEGCDAVIIGGQPVAKKGDHTDHGGMILTGCPRVYICEGDSTACMQAASELSVGLVQGYASSSLIEPVEGG